MSREKQIIGIKECIDAVYGADCAYYDVDGFAIANEIYNEGYRKQSAIIRCKDCEHYGLNSPIIKNKCCLYFSGYDEIFTEPNDYCSFAKMKGGAE